MRTKEINTQVSRINKCCSYFPCHAGLEDCAFCYCPFYPCKDTAKGEFITTKGNLKVWSCQDCGWIHKKSVVDKIFNMILNSDIAPLPSISKPKAEKTAVIILGHGSRLMSANSTIKKVAGEIKKKSGLAVVEPAYLQLCEPGLLKVIQKVVKMGGKKVIIVPFFLFSGNHVTRDIPDLIKQARKIYKGVDIVYAKSVGEDPRINGIVMDCIREAVER